MNAPSGSWSDDPLREPAQDTLGRTQYARQAADLIVRTHSFDTSVVFGLSGPWGSGKSSMINIIVSELADKHPEWQVAFFTPWATTDVAGMLEDFYAALAEAVPSGPGKKVRKTLGTLAALSAPAATMVPVAGGVAEKALAAAGEQLLKRGSWQSLFRAASQRMRKLEQPILMVVDDIDRLQSDELAVLLKVVRLLGRFPGVQYLLAYDDETLYGNLRGFGAMTGGGSAERFMEKIVQYPLVVPPLLQHQQLELLNAGLSQVRGGVDPNEALTARMNGLIDTLLALLRTPRAIDRYTAQLQHHVPLVDVGEIDDGDVYLLTLLRVSFPALYDALPHFRKELLSGHTEEFNLDRRATGDIYMRFDPATLLNAVPEESRAHARVLLLSLFPKLAGDRDFAVHGTSSGLGVGVEEYFDRYFAMDIPERDVRDSDVRAAAVAAWAGDEGPLTELFAGDDRHQILVVGKLATPGNQPTDPTQQRNFVRVLASVLNSMTEGFGWFTARNRAIALIAKQLSALRDLDAEVVLDALAPLTLNRTRLEVYASVAGGTDQPSSEGQPPWLAEVADKLADEALSEVVGNLREGDDAPDDSGILYNVHFLVSHGRADALREAVAELLAAGAVSVADVASRFVSMRMYSGQKTWQLSPEVDQQLFDLIAPAMDDPFYAEPRQRVDLDDLSWPNRRRLAAGRLTRPTTPEPPPES